MTRKKQDKDGAKTKLLNVKFSEEDYAKLKQIAQELGDVPLSSMIRILVNNQFKKYDKTGDPNSFLKQDRF